jgi:hypothetical protein
MQLLAQFGALAIGCVRRQQRRDRAAERKHYHEHKDRDCPQRDK